MATRWFGPRPIRQPAGEGWPLAIERHGSCGCCQCGGYYSTDFVFDNDAIFTKYPAFRDGLRMKLTIADVIDGWESELFQVFTEVTGLSGINGTRYFDITRTQYGCILSADDFDSVTVNYHCYETDSPIYDYNFDQIIRIGCLSSRGGDPFFSKVEGVLEYSCQDYIDQAPVPIYQDHPFIGVEFVPDSAQYGSGLTGSGAVLDISKIGWDSTRLPNVVTGDLRFFLCNILGGDQYPIDLTNANWTGIDDFYDTGTDTFKTAGTFTAEIERL